ncbi:MAG: NAD-dependent epimerase/dehydratase family protein [Acidobacteria bacterium]|nr:MAG: NAD-dependent epimerase/dehydratase family protein [Acidobacteriota bacterium]REJ99083.1 MAG: NAD-dependent epimerase/dehydratase family protein [Acidobacteriota bacterium]REK16197.1 MAG: NAD-dependent epimerase/dehydratase family protein [Acidobacteriota bacterium]REK43878.1 MAG: NAD-dependent epimerase/dehydratase family protein [Acidobacteriota bacterium]
MLNKANFRIGITCIGTGVGQAVVNSCRISALPLWIAGIGNNPIAFGNADCDETASVPDIYAPDYAHRVAEICKDLALDILIPTHDDETVLLTNVSDILEREGTRLLTSELRLLELCRDKLFEGFPDSVSRHFVNSRTIGEFESALRSGEATFPAVSKPRKGFASRGVRILLDDDDFRRTPFGSIIQEVAFPHSKDPNRAEFDRQLTLGRNPQVSEVSIQFVFDSQGKPAGRMATVNRLSYGVPVEVIPLDSEDIWGPAEEVADHLSTFGCRGPVNLQGRLTDDGLKLFELNARFTGISGIRAQMGFNEVEFCIADWLAIEGRASTLSNSRSKVGVRQIADRVFPVTRAETGLPSLAENARADPILITGGTGYLGRQIVRELDSAKTAGIWVLTREKQNADLAGFPDGCTIFDMEDLRAGKLPLGSVRTLLHAGFARPFRGEAAIAESLRFTFDLFDLAVSAGVPNIVNISSQSVYGSAPVPWSETDRPAPQTPYGQGKLAAELHLESLTKARKTTKAISIRIATITGGAERLFTDEVTASLVKQVIAGDKLTVLGGEQLIERIDVRDAALAVCAVVQQYGSGLPSVLNVGTGSPKKLSEIAAIVLKEGSRRGFCRNEHFKLEPEGSDVKQHLSVDEIARLLGWRPRISLEETVSGLFEFLAES